MAPLRGWPPLQGPVAFNLIIVLVSVLTQLHLIISAPTSTASPPADDVVFHVTSSLLGGSDVAERRRTVPSSGEDAHGVHSNAADSATNARLRRHLIAAQGCGPVCNRCRQVRTINFHLCELRVTLKVAQLVFCCTDWYCCI